MRSRNYTKEIGLDNSERPVPIVATTAIFVLIVIVAVLFARQVNALPQTSTESAPAPSPVKVSSR